MLHLIPVWSGLQILQAQQKIGDHRPPAGILSPGVGSVFISPAPRLPCKESVFFGCVFSFTIVSHMVNSWCTVATAAELKETCSWSSP
ncbi:unnamed protein product [Arctogadus glacialis]